MVFPGTLKCGVKEYIDIDMGMHVNVNNIHSLELHYHFTNSLQLKDHVWEAAPTWNLNNFSEATVSGTVAEIFNPYSIPETVLRRT